MKLSTVNPIFSNLSRSAHIDYASYNYKQSIRPIHIEDVCLAVFSVRAHACVCASTVDILPELGIYDECMHMRWPI